MKNNKLKQTIILLGWTILAPLCLATPLKVGISLVDLSNPFFTILAKEISSSVRENYSGELEVYVESSAYNLDKQIAQLELFLKDDVKIIFIAASESRAIAPFIQKAREKGAIVVAVDIESEGADISVTSDNFQAGAIACDYLAKRLDKVGEVAIINGQPISSVINRVAGCKSSLSRYQDISLVSLKYNSSGTYSGGLESMAYLMIEFPALKGVFSINDLAALGAFEATKQNNSSHILITSVDGSPAFISQLVNQDTNLIASAAQFPRNMAQRAVSLALERLVNKKVKNRRELIKTELVTRKNLADYRGWRVK